MISLSIPHHYFKQSCHLSRTNGSLTLLCVLSASDRGGTTCNIIGYPVPGGLCGNACRCGDDGYTLELLGAEVGNGRIALAAEGEGGGPRRLMVLLKLCSEDAVVRFDDGEAEEDEDAFMIEEEVGDGGGDARS